LEDPNGPQALKTVSSSDKSKVKCPLIFPGGEVKPGGRNRDVRSDRGCMNRDPSKNRRESGRGDTTDNVAKRRGVRPGCSKICR